MCGEEEEKRSDFLMRRERASDKRAPVLPAFRDTSNDTAAGLSFRADIKAPQWSRCLPKAPAVAPLQPHAIGLQRERC